ncbi:LysR family transcriptional regulator [Herbaspirillum chlorophenolicum]|uniref:LysR family transcriptional regulator n=1 Tax=Herbaspirillum chlorophenolicum TaxID=211589 RepID=A0ABW8EYT8_9BURK|nr:LysR family transcriptional regulator [Herbaspirillum chlorophenolicum]
MRNIDPFSARLFLAVIEEGSIAKAAARECIVASAVSKRVSELEALFRVPLLERGVKGVTPTPAGEAFQHHARMLLQAMDRMYGEMSEYVEGVRGRVKVLATVSSLSSRLPSDIQDFVTAHKRIKIDLEEASTPAIFRAVVDGVCDVGIAPEISSLEGLQAFPYRVLTLAVVMPAGHPLSTQKQLSYADTLEFDQVELYRGSGMATLLDNAAQNLNLPKRTYIRVLSYETICRMVASGMGVGVVPLFFAHSHGETFKLKFLPLTDAWAHPMISIAVRDANALGPASRAFVEHMKQCGVQARLQNSMYDAMSMHRGGQGR